MLQVYSKSLHNAVLNFESLKYLELWVWNTELKGGGKISCWQQVEIKRLC